MGLELEWGQAPRLDLGWASREASLLTPAPHLQPGARRRLVESREAGLPGRQPGRER